MMMMMMIVMMTTMGMMRMMMLIEEVRTTMLIDYDVGEIGLTEKLTISENTNDGLV